MQKKVFLKIGSLGLAVLLLFSMTGCSGPKEEVSYIWLIRHGRTYSNEQELLVGRGGNYDLTEDAEKEALQVGEALEMVDFERAYASTLDRTKDTAELVLEGAGDEHVQISRITDLDDISWGDAEGDTKQSFMDAKGLEFFPDAFGNADDATFRSPIHAETKYDFCRRFDRGMQQILAELEEGEDVLVAAHSSMEFWLKWKFPELENENGIDNLHVTILRVSDGEMEVVEYNKSLSDDVLSSVH